MKVKDLLRYRQAWLGVALLWIILFHGPWDMGVLGYFKSIGYGGVDICLFASGIGCFYSLSSDSNVVSFMKRRVKRLIPTYVIFIIFWLIYQYIIGKFNFQMAIGNILALQNFTGHGRDFNWYISAIFLLYILAPYFKIIAEGATPARKILFTAFLLICSVPFWGATTYIITLTRLPIFFIGMIVAEASKKDKRIGKKEMIMLSAAFMVGFALLLCSFVFAKDYLWSHGLYWYPFILITPFLCFMISYVAMLLEKTKITKPIVGFLSLCGGYSFEIYLMHIFVFEAVRKIISARGLSDIGYLVWAAGLVCIPVGCFLLRRTADLFNRLCKPKAVS